MDFTNFAALELAGALRAEREFQWSRRKWLSEWRAFSKQAEIPAAATIHQIADKQQPPVEHAA